MATFPFAYSCSNISNQPTYSSTSMIQSTVNYNNAIISVSSHSSTTTDRSSTSWLTRSSLSIISLTTNRFLTLNIRSVASSTNILMTISDSFQMTESTISIISSQETLIRRTDPIGIAFKIPPF